MGDWRIARLKRIAGFGCGIESGESFAMKTMATLAVLATSSLAAAAPYPTGSAQQRTANAIARIQAIDPQLHSILAVDPTAMGQARRIDASGGLGGIRGEPILLKDNIEAAGGVPPPARRLPPADNVTKRGAPPGARAPA